MFTPTTISTTVAAVPIQAKLPVRLRLRVRDLGRRLSLRLAGRADAVLAAWVRDAGRPAGTETRPARTSVIIASVARTGVPFLLNAP